MTETRVRIGWLVALLLGMLSPGWSQSPKVSLRLAGVTCREAAAALSLATGNPIEIRAWRTSDIPGAVGPPLIDLNERASFDWRETTFARAFRELADRYRLRPEPGHGGGYILEQVGIERPLAVYTSAPHDAQAGTRVEVRRLNVSGDYSGRAPGDRVSLIIGGVATSGDASEVYTLDNIVARDDRGGILTTERPRPQEVNHTYPGEWYVAAMLYGLQPGASRLEWLEGDVFAQARENVRRCELPIPPPPGGGRKELPGVILEFKELLPTVPPGDRFAQGRIKRGPFLRARLIHPDGRPRLPFPPRSYGLGVMLVGASGRLHAAHGVSIRGRIEDGVDVSDIGCPFPPIEEPVVGVRFEFWDWGESRRLRSFRVRDLRLPEGDSAAATLYYGALLESELVPGDPLYAADGATLVSSVELDGQPAPPGRLSLGVAAADGTPGRRWYEVAVGEDGIGRLPHLRPGAYHVLRIYRSLRPDRRAAPGWWGNSETVVRAGAGKETTLPVLQRTGREPAPRPASLPARELGVHAALKGMRISYSRTVEFLQQPEQRADGGTQLELAGNAFGIAPERVAGVRNLVAMDDRGKLLSGRGAGRITVVAAEAGRGFTWSSTPQLNPPHPLAKKLAWLEGDLLAYRKVAPVRFEAPMPPPEGGARRVVDGLQFEFDSLAPPSPEDPRGDPRGEVLLLKGRARGPRGTHFAAPGAGYPPPLLVGKSGQTYSSSYSGGAVGADGGPWEIRAYYRVAEPVTAARFDLTVWTDRAPVGSFRLTDLPLPPRRAFIPPRAPGAGAIRGQEGRPEPPGARARAFFEEGGGRLILPVRIAEQAAPGGTLTVGLARRTPEGWSPVRWIEVPVIQGAASLQDLQPGAYRLLRSYQTDQPPMVAAPGRWLHAEVEVTLAPGKETTAPALQWVAAP